MKHAASAFPLYVSSQFLWYFNSESCAEMSHFKWPHFYMKIYI